MLYIPDNYDRFEMHMAEQERELDRLPRCSECLEPIQDECAYYINDEWICERCMDEHRKSTDSVI